MNLPELRNELTECRMMLENERQQNHIVIMQQKHEFEELERDSTKTAVGLIRELTALREQNAALQADKARLDFCESSGWKSWNGINYEHAKASHDDRNFPTRIRTGSAKALAGRSGKIWQLARGRIALR